MVKSILFFAIVCLVVAGCSNTSSQRTEPSATLPGYSHSLYSPYILASAPFPFGLKDTVTNGRPNQTIAEADSIAADTTEEEIEKQIADLLERAREHYLVALQAQAEGDSLMSADEFEESIKLLNEASYFPNIEEVADFNELIRSVIEDYEKYIATIDSLGANSSIFALREKLNLDIEKIDITNIQIPPSLIPKTDVPLHINEYTKRTLAFFMGKGRVHMENWIYRSGKYFPLMSRIFAEEGLPPELMLLSLPESGLNPTARSWRVGGASDAAPGKRQPFTTA